MSTTSLFVNSDIQTYLNSVSLREPAVLAHCRADTSTLTMAKMQISPEQGQLMALLVQLMGAKRCLDIGVFTGYSSTAVALALPDDGEVVGIDTSTEWTDIAKKTWTAAGVNKKIHLIIKPAEQALQDLLDQGQAGRFDFAFIDADKRSYDTYYELCLQLLRPGGLIMLDNVLRDGLVLDEQNSNEGVAAVRELNRKIGADERVAISMLPVSDGITLAMKLR